MEHFNACLKFICVLFFIQIPRRHTTKHLESCFLEHQEVKANDSELEEKEACGVNQSKTQASSMEDSLFEQVMMKAVVHSGLQTDIQVNQEDIRALQEQVRILSAKLSELNSATGVLEWEIAKFSQRMVDARTKGQTVVHSQTFELERIHYRVCFQLYPNGEGIGENTHMSLFFRIMKGKFDDDLKSPFTHKVTLELINQTGGRDIINTFQPDPMNCAFQKPQSDMNITFGFPRFVSHTVLENGGFIEDDSILIKCRIH